MLKGIVGTVRQKVATSAHAVWLVESRSEQQQEQLERSAEEVIAMPETRWCNQVAPGGASKEKGWVDTHMHRPKEVQPPLSHALSVLVGKDRI